MAVMVQGSLNLEKKVYSFPKFFYLGGDVIDPLIDKPIVGQNDPFVYKQDIPIISNAGVTLRRSQRTKRSVISD